jgi:uncharacterized protein (DUF427 family)
MESVWDYPRPPRLESEPQPVSIEFAGEVIAQTDNAFRVLETSHPPGIYLPQDCFVAGVLQPNPASSLCEWKGQAVYWDLVVGEQVASSAGWSYPDPARKFQALRDYVSVYPGLVAACYIGDERVQAQKGDFYGGWITQNIAGPFKGAPGTWGW